MLQTQNLPLTQMRKQRRRRGANEAQIELRYWLSGVGTEDQGIGFCSPGKINGGLKPLLQPGFRDALPSMCSV